MILKLFPLFMIIFVTESIAERCPKMLTTADATTTTDELLNAFYIADPDPQTGNVVFASHPQNRDEQQLTGIIIGSSLTFNEWLDQLHDGRDDFKNLWVYISRLIASDIGELFGHKQSHSSQAAARPRPAINFAELGKTFTKVCTFPDKFETIWPFSCFDSKFFCALSTALKQPLFTVMHPVNKVKCQQANVFQVNNMSQLAVDNDLRDSAIHMLFHADIVTEFNDVDLLKPLYQSGLVRDSISLLLSDQDQLRLKIYNQLLPLRQRLDVGCSLHGTITLATAYYCKAHAIVTKTIECYALPDSSICVYDPMFQQYFQIGKFSLHSELDHVNEMRSRLRDSLTAIASAIADQHALNLRAQLDLHQPYLLVDQDTCRNDWPKGFNCGNEQCKLETIVRFDCLMKIVTRAATNFLTAMGLKRWTDSNISKERAFLNIFLFYPPMRRQSNLPQAEIESSITDFHLQVDGLSKKLDKAGFETLLGKLPPIVLVPSWVTRSLCSPGNIRHGYTDFCLITSLVNAIFQFMDTTNKAETSRTRVLNPWVGYIRLLEQFQLQQIAAFLNSQSQTYFQLLNNEINQIPGQIEENFQAVGSYFESLANYDTKKAEADIAYIAGSLNTFKNNLGVKTVIVAQKFGLLMVLAIGAAAAELLQRGVELALEIAFSCNPLKHIFGGSDPGSILDRLSEFMQGVVGLTKLIVVATKILPELGRRAQYLKSGFEQNDEFLGLVKTLVENFNSDDPDVEDKAEKFLEMYNNYSPAILRSDITAFGTLWEATVDEVCEVAFEGGSAAAAAVEIGIASTGDCISIKPLIAEVITLDEEIHDYQFDLIETLATAVRAKYASKLAKVISVAYTPDSTLDISFFKHNAIISSFVLTSHIWEIVNEYCDILTYTSGGLIPTACVAAIALPDKNTVTRLISHEQPDTCTTGSRHKTLLNIPTSTSSSANAGDKSFINIDKLFNGETVIFKIPDSSWLVTHNVISRSEVNNAIFVEQFQMFLPVTFDNKSLVLIKVQPNDANILRFDETRYIFKLSAFQSKYRVNEPYCFGTKTWLPYDLCESLGQVCVTNEAKVERDIQPSIYNAWRIKITDPKTVTLLNPKTPLDIKVGLIYCTETPDRKKREVVDESPADYSLLKNRKTRQADSQYCCPNNKYWSGTSCQNCPTGSTRRLSGYYCE